MIEPIEPIKELIDSYKKLPGIGYKTAVRLAYATLDLTPEDREEFISALQKSITDVKKCPVCGTYFTDECPICSDPKRDKTTLLVLANSKDILSIEKTGGYNGTYFTLSGTISPLRNRTADTIGIPQLKKRIAEMGVKELILALPTSLEGETTSLYIANIYKDNPSITVSRIAYGIPVGTDLEYLDDITITRSIANRTKLK